MVYLIGKPKDLNWYISTFVHELKHIIENGLTVNSKRVSIKVRCFICDTPARCFLKGVIGSNGYSACLKCVTKGKYSYTAKTMIYPQMNAELRTDAKFRSGVYGQHHKSYSIISELPINMIDDFPIADSLHIIDLGSVHHYNLYTPHLFKYC